MKITWDVLCLVFCLFISTLHTALSIRCYQCVSTQVEQDPFQCDELFDDTDIEPQSCDEVYNAQYCVKQIGRFEGKGIKCFQCNAAFNISCTDLLIGDGTLQPEECDQVFEAEFCVKTTGRGHGGGIGTKRFCSSLDLGNYCNYVQQPGDVLEYRSCYFTCSGDGCNSARPSTSAASFLLLAPITVLIFMSKV